MMNSGLFKEVEVYQLRKATEATCGDAFLSHRNRESGRIVSVLSDGLGSGVKANILASMTVKMALKFAESELDIVRSAEIMMDALPVCAVRKIGYATYTVVDCRDNRTVRVIEQGNPGFICVRNGTVMELPYTELKGRRQDYRRLRVTEFEPQPEDRILFFSDGVTEAGMGSRMYKLGWRRSGVVEFVEQTLEKTPGISAGDLVRRIVRTAISKEPDGRAGDDTSCAAVYMRKPRRTLMLSGPPFAQNRDREFAHLVESFEGRKAICGGTSADIVARELGRSLHTPLLGGRSRLPPVSEMGGVDLVTEGILTLTEAQRLLEDGAVPCENNAAVKLVDLLRDSDVVEMV
ncbi:MAG: SpoIIE family protein phosphatase, partial [Kiritimatiellales bacterium]